MFDIVLMISLFGISLSIVVAFYRIIKGPSMPDRIMALDMIGIIMVAGVAVLSLILRSAAFLDIILLLGILSFIGTIAFALFLERGAIIERKRD